MKNFIQNLKRLVYFLPYVFVFIASLYRPKDPDLGWHLKYGEYFFKHHQILRDNIFSTMMPNFHWANGSWGTDLITYFIYNHWGFFGLTLASALIVTLTFFFFSKAAKFTFFENSLFFPILIFLELPLNNFSFRSQQFSFLFLGILFFILSRYKHFSKIIFIIPLIFVIWVNLHAESFFGLVLFGLWIFFTMIKNFYNYQKEDRKFYQQELIFLTGIFIFCCFAMFMNPFSISVPLFALSHFNNQLLRNINEYAPFVLFSLNWINLSAIAIFSVTCFIYLLIKKSILKNLSILGILLILIIMSFFVRRYAWPAYYLTLSIFLILISNIKSYLKKYLYLIAIVISSISVLFTIALKIPFSQFTNMSWDTYCSIQTIPCSSKSAEYLKNNSLTNNLFSYYDWGGWLIWNYPDVKPSIDGRMSVWIDNFGYSAVADYRDYLTEKKSINNSNYDVVYLPQDRSPLYLELSNLISQNKWKLVYRDDSVVIVVRVK
jgi:hypothetical protein